MARPLPLHQVWPWVTLGENDMAKQAITVDGEKKMVREDTAKSFRGVHWALISIAAFVVIAALLFFSGMFSAVFDGGLSSPAQIEREARQ